MVECGKMSDYPTCKKITILMIIEINFLCVIFLSSCGNMAVFIRDYYKLPKKASAILAFIAEAIMISSMIWIILAYCNKIEKYLKIALGCFITLLCFDFVIVAAGMSFGYHVVYHQNMVRFISNAIVSTFIYFQLFKKESSEQHETIDENIIQQNE